MAIHNGQSHFGTTYLLLSRPENFTLLQLPYQSSQLFLAANSSVQCGQFGSDIYRKSFLTTTTQGSWPGGPGLLQILKRTGKVSLSIGRATQL